MRGRAGGLQPLNRLYRLYGGNPSPAISIAERTRDGLCALRTLRAGKLFLDADVVPVRGQLTLLKPQTEIDYSYLAADPISTLYMFPRETSIVLGGTRQRGKTHLSIDGATVERMLREHGKMAGFAGRRLEEVG